VREKSFRERFWAELLGATDNAEPAPLLDYQAYRFRDRFWFELLGTPLPADPQHSVVRSSRPASSRQPWRERAAMQGALAFAATVAVAAAVGMILGAALDNHAVAALSFATVTASVQLVRALTTRASDVRITVRRTGHDPINVQLNATKVDPDELREAIQKLLDDLPDNADGPPDDPAPR